MQKRYTVTKLSTVNTEGHEDRMKASTRTGRGKSSPAALLTTLLVAAATALPMVAVRAQGTDASKEKMMAPTAAMKPAMMMAAPTDTNGLPSSVLLFPAVVPSDAPAAGAAATAGRPVAESIVTDAVRRFLSRAGVGVVVYNRRLPAVERAVAEGLRPEDALKGPGDDPRKAKNFSDILGASEYLTVLIDDYKFDPATRTATFNLSVARNSGDGTSLSATAQKAVGTAPADVPASRQEAAAVANAADVAGEQTVEAVYPGAAARINPPKEAPKKKRRGLGNLLIPAVAVGAAIIAPHT